jgi:hypothetical protein
MPCGSGSTKKTKIRLMEEDIEKGLNEKKVQNLVLKKILEQVDPDRKEQPPVRKIKDK